MIHDTVTVPDSTEYEQGLLACCFLDPKCIQDSICSGIEDATFSTMFHADIWSVLVQMDKDGTHPSEIEVADCLARDHEHDKGGAYRELNTLTEAVQTTVSMPFYIKEALRISKLRKTREGCLTALDRITKDDDPERIAKDLLQTLSDSATETSQDTDIPTVTESVINDLKQRNQDGKKFVGLGTGLSNLDTILGGFRESSFNIIAGRSKAGKTTLALQVALHNAKQGIFTRIWSLEMSDEQLLFKVLCAIAQVNPNRANDCLLTQAEFDRLESARHEICKLPLAIKDIANVTTERIAAQHKQDIAKYGQAFCVVDYLQLVRSIERKLSREQQVATISRDFKILFKDTKSQGLVLCQLNRGSESENREPRKSDLRESGSLESDADSVTILYNDLQDPDKTWAKVAANRHGAEGKAALSFNKPISHFTNY